MSNMSLRLTIVAGLATLFCASGFAASSEGILAEHFCEAEPVSEALQKVELMNGQLYVEGGNFLVFERNGTRLEAQASQPDYGAIIGLRQTRNGEIFALGHQRIYRVSINTDAGGPILVTNMLPILFQKPCNWMGNLLGTCVEQGGVFSETLSAVFLSGYNDHGEFRSYVFGLSEEVMDLSDTPTPQYQRDCGKNSIVLVGNAKTSILDASGSIREVSADGD